MTLREKLGRNAGREFNINLGGTPALMRIYANGVEIKVKEVEYFFYKENNRSLNQTGQAADPFVTKLVSDTLAGGIANA